MKTIPIRAKFADARSFYDVCRMLEANNIEISGADVKYFILYF